ncbi:hypothetical protein PMAYCL1PPCAC_28289, partial [Pristionchus mayeri]
LLLLLPLLFIPGCHNCSECGHHLISSEIRASILFLLDSLLAAWRLQLHRLCCCCSLSHWRHDLCSLVHRLHDFRSCLFHWLHDLCSCCDDCRGLGRLGHLVRSFSFLLFLHFFHFLFDSFFLLLFFLHFLFDSFWFLLILLSNLPRTHDLCCSLFHWLHDLCSSCDQRRVLDRLVHFFIFLLFLHFHL